MAAAPTIAERGYVDFVTGALEEALEAAKQQASSLTAILTCDACNRIFDSTDPRCHVDEPKVEKSLLGRDITTQLAICPACNIEAVPELAEAALAKALKINPRADQAPVADAAGRRIARVVVVTEGGNIEWVEIDLAKIGFSSVEAMQASTGYQAILHAEARRIAISLGLRPQMD